MAQQSVRDTSARIDELLDELAQSAPPALVQRVEELLRCVMALYGAGLERLVETAGPEVVRRLAADELVGNLLVLHDLHPDDVDSRVQAALDGVRPYLGSHAGGVALSGVDAEGIVHLRLEGSCDGCPSSTETVRNAIEDAVLTAAPDVVAVAVEGMVESDPALLQIPPFRAHDDPEPEPEPAPAGWAPVDLDVRPRTHIRVEVAGESLLVANLDGTLVAYLDRCPACEGPLSAGTLDRDALTCAGCARGYDLRLAGRALAGDGAHLAPLPLLPEHGAWKVALPRRVDR